MADAPFKLADYKARVGLLDSKIGKRLEIELEGPPQFCVITLVEPFVFVKANGGMQSS